MSSCVYIGCQQQVALSQQILLLITSNESPKTKCALIKLHADLLVT